MNQRTFFYWPAALLASLFALAPAPSSAQGFKWWQSEQFQKDLQLTTEQIARIEEVFQTAVPELRQQKATLDRLEKDLAQLIDTSADENAVMQ